MPMTDRSPPSDATDGDGTAFSSAELLDALGHAVIATDLDGVIVYWNPAAERLYGWPAATALGRTITEVTVPQVSQDTATDIMAALRDGISWSGGFPVQRRDGTVFHALVTDTGIYRAGEPVGVIGVSTNLGDALRPLLERSSDAALLLSATGEVTYASPAVTALFGWRAEDLVGRPFAGFVHPDDRAMYERHLAASPEARRVIEVRVQGAEGWIWAEAALTNLLDDPLVRGVVCNLHYSERLAQLHERERISQQLHTDILQALFGASLYLESALASASPEERLRIESAQSAIAGATEALRRVVQPTDDLDES